MHDHVSLTDFKDVSNIFRSRVNDAQRAGVSKGDLVMVEVSWPEEKISQLDSPGRYTTERFWVYVIKRHAKRLDGYVDNVLKMQFTAGLHLREVIQLNESNIMDIIAVKREYQSE